MDVREKLIEILKKPIFPHELADPIEAVADYLLDSGVTVQDGKPLEAFLHHVDVYKGLKAKYLVFKADTGESVENCFVLRPDKDPASVEALRAYASATDNETLAKDIYNWVGKGVTVQEWIPVDDRLPDWRDGKVLVFTKYGFSICERTVNNRWRGQHANWITHWAYLPHPPKGE